MSGPRGGYGVWNDLETLKIRAAAFVTAQWPITVNWVSRARRTWRGGDDDCLCACPRAWVARAEENEDVTWATATKKHQLKVFISSPLAFFCVCFLIVSWSVKRRRVTAGSASCALRKIPNSCSFVFTVDAFPEAEKIFVQDVINSFLCVAI